MTKSGTTITILKTFLNCNKDVWGREQAPTCYIKLHKLSWILCVVWFALKCIEALVQFMVPGLPRLPGPHKTPNTLNFERTGSPGVQDSRHSQNPHNGGNWESRESWTPGLPVLSKLRVLGVSGVPGVSGVQGLPGLPRPLISVVLGVLGDGSPGVPSATHCLMFSVQRSMSNWHIFRKKSFLTIGCCCLLSLFSH